VNSDKLVSMGKSINTFMKSKGCTYAITVYPELKDFLRNIRSDITPEMLLGIILLL
jgi:hypothetical protein